MKPHFRLHFRHLDSMRGHEWALRYDTGDGFPIVTGWYMTPAGAANGMRFILAGRK